jgi:hypothetical protein
MSNDLFKDSIENSLFTKSIAIYTTIILAVCLISLLSYDENLSLIDYFKNYFTSTVSRNTTIDRWKLLEGMNFGSVLFHAKPLTLEAVALSVYPLVLFSIFFQQTSLLESNVLKTGLISSLILILLKNSRGEIIFLLLLFSYPFAKKIIQRARYLVLLIFPVGFIQLLLSSKILNGRSLLNNFFIESINLFGNGIGFASDRINILTKGDYSSFHNIHFELISNLGIIVYFLVISMTGYYLLKDRYNKTKHIIVCIYFFLMTTNFELFDVYFATPLAMAFAKNEQQ